MIGGCTIPSPLSEQVRGHYIPNAMEKADSLEANLTVGWAPIAPSKQIKSLEDDSFYPAYAMCAEFVFASTFRHFVMCDLLCPESMPTRSHVQL